MAHTYKRKWKNFRRSCDDTSPHAFALTRATRTSFAGRANVRSPVSILRIDGHR